MNVAFIPVRGGSKSIPLKNIKPICGKPLVYWTVKAACQCKYIDVVYIATDSDKIKETVETFKCGDEAEIFSKAQVIGRSAESASDTASTEFAMLEFAANYEFDNVILVQATSPMLTAADLDSGFELFNTEGTDSVLSVVRQYRFLWDKDEKGNVSPSNYDVFHRPRRQEFDGYMMENGAFYISSKFDVLKYQNRVSGNIKAYEMCEDSAFEIDEPSDWIIIEALMQKNGLVEEKIIAEEKKDVPEIKMFLTDCDGCLTDGGMYYSEHGDELKKFNTRDGMGFALLHGKGIITGIVTSESVDLNRRRAEKLKLDIFEAGCKDKVYAVKRLCEQFHVELENVAYMGDDINDLDTIKMVGLGCAPADAMPQVKAAADYVTKAKGGRGVIREVVEKILQEASK
ncbi:N-acylneuraminate cytidylyltransferase [Bariatricus massiliensis]|uniref:N-acylneuraminate cytidylyltransferase n=1 Tax=Bariatricus massiliensis TaxID=1745713 RepID=A0ABS8DDM3_9FIRM|nr:N-acylneuraminate cytidylyltransferase [Bariatricus massiliensis]MCB7302637.1 N-acylneuraminate cytidylyltransferase [Bariatricus massiliensis]MCB7373853.1 N-acylneuraminate cytidylyltransferase [Bariatricus massiliensis]MCB7386523.1 N-acylneuraminate cytidylyltransferase [Bariatricus massiliensis]MCB7410685.1 N-acylneuraminate cytidylyltransferase [Bariatricus massiliensis]MCQ5253477.1 N-acylneuraminate cytidylyltransferase [Bariatricus massiliensis]